MLPSSANPQQQGEPSTSLTSDMIHNNETLMDILNRLIKVGDALNGGVPRDIPQDANKPPEPNSLRRLIDRTGYLLGDLIQELSRVEGKL